MDEDYQALRALCDARGLQLKGWDDPSFEHVGRLFFLQVQTRAGVKTTVMSFTPSTAVSILRRTLEEGAEEHWRRATGGQREG
jgi:hypothetical protein